MFGIDYLLSPYTFERFFADQLGKKAILIPGDENKFDGLLEWQDINRFIRYSPQAGNSTRLVLDKQSLSSQAFTEFNKFIKDGSSVENAGAFFDPFIPHKGVPRS